MLSPGRGVGLLVWGHRVCVIEPVSDSAPGEPIPALVEA